MYYEEKIIGGVLCWRGTPDGQWIQTTAEQLTAMLTEKYAAGRKSAFLDAADRFEGKLPFNWVCADGYANGFSIGGELRYMAHEVL